MKLKKETLFADEGLNVVMKARLDMQANPGLRILADPIRSLDKCVTELGATISKEGKKSDE